MPAETGLPAPKPVERTGDPRHNGRDWHDIASLFVWGATFLAAVAAAFFTGRQAYLANKQLKVARDVLAVTQDTEKRQLRAYITSNGGGATVGLEPKTKKIMMHGAVRLHNSGGTPAYNLTVKVAAKIATRDAISFTEIGPINDEYGASIMGPGTDYEVGVWTDYDPADMGPLEAGLKRTFIWGRVDYDDAFGNHRWFDLKEVSSDQLGTGKWAIGAHKLGEHGN
jgi:hypothetical protein